MQEQTVTALEAIQAILAPAVGISAVGLLLLGLSSRYSAIVNRIRLLNDEKRRFSRQLGDAGSLEYTDNARYISIARQHNELLRRSRFIRNAILAMQTAIALFVLTSVLIGFSLFINAEVFRAVPLFLFIFGMIAVLVGITYAGLEIHHSYKVILMEVKGEE